MGALKSLLKFAVHRIVGKIPIGWKIYKVAQGYRLRRWYLVALRYMPALPFFLYAIVGSSSSG